MKILVTGGAGFIGSRVVLKLEAKGHEVIILDDFTKGSVNNLKGFLGKKVSGDVRDNTTLKSIGAVDAVIHESSITTDAGFCPPATVADGMSVNVTGFINILEYARLHSARLVYASSSAVIPEPCNFYGLSKLMMEQLAAMYYREFGLKSTGLRYFNTYGAGEESKQLTASMVSQFLWAMLKDKPVIIYGDGTQQRDFTYVDDSAEATIMAMDADIDCGVFEIGTGTSTTYTDLIKILDRHLGRTTVPRYIPNPLENYQEYTKADTAPAEEKIGFKAGHTLDIALPEMLKHYRSGKQD